MIKIGLCGLGTVGSSTYRLLAENSDLITRRGLAPVEITHVGARRDNAACDTSTVRVSRDIFDVARDPEVQVLVELIGGTTVARELLEVAITSGKHVVTANKALIAEHGNEIFALADQHGVSVRYEAAVAGGIPIIKALREGLAGNRINWLAGIINGTGNYILTAMHGEGRAFDDVLSEAQALGYAEADPTFDVEGIDAAHKLMILASLAFGIPLCFDRVYTEGIASLTPGDLKYARELGYRIKHLGIAKQHGDAVELRVHPTLIPESELLASVDGVRNAVLIEGNAVGPTLYCGAGAGGDATASAVVADLVDLARDLSGLQRPRIPALGVPGDALAGLPVIPMADVRTPWYLRMEVDDRAGVMSAIAGVFSDRDISIEALIQKPPVAGESRVPLIVLTDTELQSRVDSAVQALQSLDSVRSGVTRIRVETLQ